MPKQTERDPVPVKRLTKTQKKLLAAWVLTAAALASYKESESTLRTKVIKELFGNLALGVNKVLVPGALITATGKVNKRIDEAVLNTVMEEMDENSQVVGVLIEYKPALVADGYKALSPKYKKIFDQALVITPGTPTLEIKPIK